MRFAEVTIGISAFQQPLAWLSQAVKSALGQTVSELEVVVRIDGADGVDPPTMNWLLLEAECDPRLRIIDGQSRLGNFGSLRTIFASSDSEFIIQLDGDDQLDQRAAEIAIRHLRDHPEMSYVYTNALDIDESGVVISQHERQLIPYNFNIMLVQFMTFHMRCVRRSSYELVGGYRPGLLYCGDYDLSLRLSEVGNVGYIPENLYLYRLHNNNESIKQKEDVRAESFMVARSAFYRRGLAYTHYITRNKDSVKLLEWTTIDMQSLEKESVAISRENYVDWIS